MKSLCRRGERRLTFRSRSLAEAQELIIPKSRYLQPIMHSLEYVWSHLPRVFLARLTSLQRCSSCDAELSIECTVFLPRQKLRPKDLLSQVLNSRNPSNRMAHVVNPGYRRPSTAAPGTGSTRPRRVKSTQLKVGSKVFFQQSSQSISVPQAFIRLRGRNSINSSSTVVTRNVVSLLVYNV